MRPLEPGVPVDAATQPSALSHHGQTHLLGRGRPQRPVEHQAGPVVLPSVVLEAGLEQPRLDLESQGLAVEVRRHRAQHGLGAPDVADAPAGGSRHDRRGSACAPRHRGQRGQRPLRLPGRQQRLGLRDRQDVGQPTGPARHRPDLGRRHDQPCRGLGLTRCDQESGFDEQHARGQPCLLVRSGAQGHELETTACVGEVGALERDPGPGQLGVSGAGAPHARDRRRDQTGHPARSPQVTLERPDVSEASQALGTGRGPGGGVRAATERRRSLVEAAVRDVERPQVSLQHRRQLAQRARAGRGRGHRAVDRFRGREDTWVSPGPVLPDLHDGPAPGRGVPVRSRVRDRSQQRGLTVRPCSQRARQVSSSRGLSWTVIRACP